MKAPAHVRVELVADDDAGRPFVWYRVGDRIERAPVTRAEWPRYAALLGRPAVEPRKEER